MPVKLLTLGTYEQPDPLAAFDEGAAEITAFDAASQHLFVVNGASEAIDVLDVSNPSKPKLAFSIDITPFGESPNSVAVKNGIVAVAVESEPVTDPGKVVFFKTDGTFLEAVTVGALPDMLTFTPDGSKVLVANEGEPNSYNQKDSVDPEGSVSIIDLSQGIKHATVVTAGFTDFNDDKEKLIARGVRIFGPNATVAQDLEPEFIAVSEDGKSAFVTLQENNAVAVLDVKRKSIPKILPLGVKDFNKLGNSLDASDEDGAINIQNWPVVGFYQPDAIASYTSGGKQYYVTANEGDARDYDGFSEEARVKDLTLDPLAYPDADTLQQDRSLGRLKTTTVNGDSDGDGDVDLIHAFGARSFSIWDSQVKQVFDSGNEIELETAKIFPSDFNSTDNENGSFDDRSDDKGPEPEGIAVGEVDGRTYAFVGLERIGGVMVYDITHPKRASFIQYINTRDFTGVPEEGTAGDLAPEGLTFISATESPTGVPLLAVANEVSGTVSIFEVKNLKSSVIDFESPALPAGTVITDQLTGVTVTATGFGAMLFDTANPTGGDADLVSDSLGNVLILSEDGNAADPDDDAAGGTFQFVFDNRVEIASVQFLDVEEAGGTIELFYDNDSSLASIDIATTTDGGLGTVNVGIAGVSRMDVTLAGSGAIAAIDLF